MVITSLDNASVSFGTPPYYLTALEVNGIPTTSLVGADRTALRWVVPHAAGNRLSDACCVFDGPYMFTPKFEQKDRG